MDYRRLKRNCNKQTVQPSRCQQTAVVKQLKTFKTSHDPPKSTYYSLTKLVPAAKYEAALLTELTNEVVILGYFTVSEGKSVDFSLKLNLI